MTIAGLVICVILAVLCIGASYFLTPGSGSENEGDEETQKAEAAEKNIPLTQGVPKELTKKDKNHIKNLVDSYINEYTKTKKDSLGETVDKKAEKAVKDGEKKLDERFAEYDKKSSEKLDKRFEELSAKADEKAKEIETYYDSVKEDIDRNKAAGDSVYNMILDKEKNLKISLNLVDEYKESLEKANAELDKKLAEAKSIPAITAAAGLAVQASKADKRNKADAAEEAVSEAVEESAEEIAEEVAGEIAADTEEAVADENVADGDVEEAADAEDTAEDVEEAADAEDIAEEVEEAEDIADEVEEAKDAEDTAEENEEAVVAEDFDEEVDEDADDEDIDEDDEDAGNEDDDDEIDDDEPDDFDGILDDDDDEDDDFEEESAENNLDEILRQEGIEISSNNKEDNIMGMYNAGFSILEISKVLKIGVSEVKKCIDAHQGE